MHPYHYNTGTNVAVAQQRFVMKVFGWMFAGLSLTGIIGLLLAANPDVYLYFKQNPLTFYGILGVEILLLILLPSLLHRISAFTATFFFFLYAALNGINFSLIIAPYTGVAVVYTFFVTAGIFGIFALYGYLTKRDLSSLGNLLFFALIGLILATIANIFLESSILDSIILYAGVLIFVGLTAYDIQRIKQMPMAGSDEEVTKAAIIGALTLYLDFINLFIYLLRLIGDRD
ncbi:Bax inhibitor-1/YccA family protein [Polycladomyces subterraneus]|uniref:Bax inhibitor-1/YccA family protein n=1 Tax=Polycladomyces subterraneus TaxID=1016997 RepID=A0ABT8IP72_9BACL|nr:Bax inhibitor-1/YccA family protein [Polycladomyces subterraneus]MDN4594585.1 Bax inhibitor-1/YccA family protein [Polycladomyces subterraneus]